MNKKTCIVIIALILISIISVIVFYNMFMHQTKRITPEDAEKLCYSVIGEKDKETGFLFSFGVSGIIEKEEKEYYVIRASWLVNNDHMSYIGDFLVSEDGKEIYNAYLSDDEYIIKELIWSE